MKELIENGYTPSFCTACYRLGRTGGEFMEFARPGFIQNYCTPNAILTLKEYLEDYATNETKQAGKNAILKALSKMGSNGLRGKVEERLSQIEQGKRDLYF